MSLQLKHKLVHVTFVDFTYFLIILIAGIYGYNVGHFDGRTPMVEEISLVKGRCDGC